MMRLDHKIYARDPALCLSDFKEWLGKSLDTASPRLIADYFHRATIGIFGVACFCGRPAVDRARLSISHSRPEENVGLCDEHIKQYTAAQEVITALQSKIYRALNSGGAA